VLTDVVSVWNIHEHHHHDEDEEKADNHHHEHHHDEDKEEEKPHREITSLLITYKSPLAAATLVRTVNKTSSMQAASPAMEVSRITRIIGFGGDAVQAFGLLLVAIAAAGFFMTLFNAVNDRKYEIALLRILGATRRKIFAFVLVEGLALGVAGTVLGIIIGHVLAYGVQYWIESTRHITLSAIGFDPYEAVGAAIAIGISAIVSVIPAFIAYRVNVVEVISKEA
jgi:putative ABC transport system permease protein